MFLFLFSSVIINEVMANVPGKESTSGDRNEWIELYNPTEDTVDLSGWIIDDLDAKDEIVPWKDALLLSIYPDVLINTTKIPPKGYALIMDPEYLEPDPEDKFEHPYKIPGGTVIVTIDDTSIGDGLSTKDPIILVSPDLKDSSTFGTPFLEDDFPYDPGDGVSLERIDPSAEDKPENWSPCLIPEGCTPGAENSTRYYIDGAIDSIPVQPSPGKVKNNADIFAYLSNRCYKELKGRFSLYIEDKEYSKDVVIPERSYVFLNFQWVPEKSGDYLIFGKIEIPEDMNPENDTLSVKYSVRGKGLVTIYPAIISKDDSVEINYSIPEGSGSLFIATFDTSGRLLDILVDKRVSKGDRIFFSPNYRNGVYLLFYRYRGQNKIYEFRVPFYIFKK